MNRIEAYVNEVLSRIPAEEPMRRRLAEDLTAHISEAAPEGDWDSILAKMGPPEEMAEELMDGIWEKTEDVVRELERTRAELRAEKRRSRFEYKSKTRVCGIPLVHVRLSGGGFAGLGVAKGIIAVGDISVGLVSVGGLALGGLCLGGIGAGLLTFGGLSVALLLAVGGAAIAPLAFGGLAVGMLSFGGCAIASHIAVGGYARATVAIGGTAEGLHAISTGGTSFRAAAVTAARARALILEAYPGMWGWLVRLLTAFFR